MQVIFAAGDVGGARGLIPIIKLCDKRSISFAVLENGYFVNNMEGGWKKFFPPDFDIQDPAFFFKQNGIKVLVFSSSVFDITALSIARHAKKQGVSVIHVLDSWTGYQRRMEMDDLTPFQPDIYTVMDEIAREGAIIDGIDASILQLTGHPALASLRQEYEVTRNTDVFLERKKLGFDAEKALIVFISEPVGADQGENPNSLQFRGYTEKQVMGLFAEYLQPHADSIELAVLQHPRENIGDLINTWDKCGGSLKYHLTSGDIGRKIFFSADGIAGMASILLYEAWLLGKPLVSIQPGLRVMPLRMLEKREDVFFIDSDKDVAISLTGWMKKIQNGKACIPRSDMDIHENAPEKIFQLINQRLMQT